MTGKRGLLILLLLSISLMGATSEDLVGCTCGSARDEGDLTEIPSGDGEGIAKSENYNLKRSQIGASREDARTSADDIYRVSATLGHYTIQGMALADHYVIHHAMNRDVIIGADR